MHLATGWLTIFTGGVKMWIDNDDRIMNIFEIANNQSEAFPVKCPICEKKGGHIYIHRHDAKHGGIWMWCDRCHSYAHVSGIIPDWCENPPFIDETQLTARPSYLNTLATELDSWTNSLLFKRE